MQADLQRSSTLRPWPRSRAPPLPNGLPLHRIDLAGTRAVTVLVAFDAGARTERPEENGMAHFLEHLVFKGGEKYDDYRKVNETAERMGAVLNAYTSHDLVAFHITCRAEVVARRDRPADRLRRAARRSTPDELDRERGVVIQEIARANDQPSVVAEHLIDRAAFGDHPLGRPVLGPEEHLRTFTRDAIVAFRPRQWAGARGGAFLVGNLGHVPEDCELAETVRALPVDPGQRRAPSRRRRSSRGRWSRSATPSSRTCGCPTARRSTSTNPQQRAALSVYSTLLGGSMGSRLFDEIREQRGLAYSVYSVDHAFADVPILQLSAGLESGKCVEAFTRMREIVDELRTDGPTEEEFERARAYAAGRARAGVREHQRGRALRGAPDGRLRAGHRPRRCDRRARRGHDSRRCTRSRAGSPRSLRRLRRAAHGRRVRLTAPFALRPSFARSLWVA